MCHCSGPTLDRSLVYEVQGGKKYCPACAQWLLVALFPVGSGQCSVDRKVHPLVPLVWHVFLPSPYPFCFAQWIASSRDMVTRMQRYKFERTCQHHFARWRRYVSM
jgi:hypothetical protein